MKARSFLLPNSLYLSGLAALGFALSGCESMQSAVERRTPSGEVTATADLAAAEVAEVNGRMDDAVRQLENLLNHPDTDLRRQYNTYVDSVDKLEAAEQRLRERNEELNRKSREYLIEWDREIATITNDDLRNRSLERKTQVAERLDNLSTSYAEARDDLVPFLRRLNEIKSAMSVDLTSAGIANARGSLDWVRNSTGPAREALNNLAGAFREMRTALSDRDALVRPRQ